MYGKISRLVSLLGASALALIIMIYPVALSQDGAAPSHGLLALVMLGISAGFVHGVGFMPKTVLWRWLFHPALAWLLMTTGLVLML
jgi:predicted membrane protein